MSQEQQHFKTWRTARTGDLKTQTDSQVLGISERLLDAHALRIQPDDGGGAQMPQPQTRYQEPGFAGTAGAFGARTSHAPDAVDVKPMSSFPRAFGKYRAHHDRVAARVEANAQIVGLRAGAGIPVTRRNPGAIPPQLQTVIGVRLELWHFHGVVEEAALNEIREATNKGWALGHDRFRDEIAHQAARRAAPLPRGRPARRLGERKPKKTANKA